MWRGRLEVLLDVDVADAERRFGLALRRLEARAPARRRSRTTRMPRPPPPATALMMTGIADVLGDLERLLFAVDRAVAAGQHRHAGLLHRPARPGLVAQQRMTLRIGPMKRMWQASQTSAR